MSIERIRTETRREQITEAAMNLIASRGVSCLSMTVLARRIGIVPSGIYRHFDSKEEILDAVLELLKKRLFRNIAIVREETGDPVDRLKRLLVLHIRLILNSQALPRLIFSGDIYAGRPGHKMKTYKIVTDYLGEIAKIIREGQERDRINPELDPDMLSIVFLGLIQPTAVLWHLSDGEFDAGKQIERAWPYFAKTIETAPHAPPGTL